MKVFYHNDADGKCAASIIFNQGGYSCENSEYISIDYTDDFPIGDIKGGEEVWIVDFSIEPDVMKKLLEKTSYVFWVDHHVSSIDKYGEYKELKELRGIRSVDYSGAELTWLCVAAKYGFGHDIRIEESNFNGCPKYIRLVGDRDMWNFKYGDYSKWFHEFWRYRGEPGPTDSFWNEVIDAKYVEIEVFRKGEILVKHSEMINKSIIDSYAYEMDFCGYTVLACNSNVFTSELFGDRVKDYPFVVVYCDTGKKWKVSLYSVNMDVVDIAKKHGGGGHPRACGYTSYEFPF